MDPWLSYLAIILAPILAIVLHELTHYITIWPIAERVWIQRAGTYRLETMYQIYNDSWRMTWGDISNISPSIVGVSLLITAVLTGFDPFVLENLWTIPFWLVYTVGGPADYASLFG
jgi:hypothetical protein